MKKFRSILILDFLLCCVIIVEAKEININNPVDLACDFACYYSPEYAVGFNVDNTVVEMYDGKYIAVSVNNVKPICA